MPGAGIRHQRGTSKSVSSRHEATGYAKWALTANHESRASRCCSPLATQDRRMPSQRIEESLFRERSGDALRWTSSSRRVWSQKLEASDRSFE